MISIDYEGNCGVLRMQRADLNALNEALLAALRRGLDEAIGDPRAQTIVITGTTEMFMAGADLPFFARCLLRGEIERILSFTRDCHELLRRIEESPKPVIAWVRGPALGAGLELALACRSIVAGGTAKFALPETGLGIYPGMGGTQRTPRRIGPALAKWMIGTGTTLPAAVAWELGLIDRVSDGAQRAEEVVATLGTPTSRPAISPRYQALAALFGGHSLMSLRDGSAPAPTDPQCIRAVVQLRSKAPLALAAVDRLIDPDLQLPLAEGIEREFAGLGDLFRTEDAKTGILTFGRRAPEFVAR